jgi:hypothetical protein
MSLLVTMLAVCALAQGCALVGFNIMHDGAHESYAHSKTINWLMGSMLNIVAETCHAFALLCYPTVRAAIAGHYRFLKTMGRRPNVLSSPSSPGTTPTAAIITATQGRSWGMQ